MMPMATTLPIHVVGAICNREWPRSSQVHETPVGAICNREWVCLEVQFAITNRSHRCFMHLR